MATEWRVAIRDTAVAADAAAVEVGYPRRAAMIIKLIAVVR